MNWTVELISDSCTVCAQGVCIVFTLLSLRSEWSQGFHIHVSYEVRPRPDVAVFVKALAVLSLGLLCVYCTVFNIAGHGAMEGTEKDGGMFILFLVQYAVHKSLALKILQFLLISFVVKWVHCCFFFSLKLYGQLKWPVLHFFY